MYSVVAAAAIALEDQKRIGKSGNRDFQSSQICISWTAGMEDDVIWHE